jgi:maltose/moltooligosaccharide transporter
MTLARLIGIGAGSLALAVIWGLYNVFMPLLLGDFVESRALRGAIMGLDNVIAIVLIPIVGAWSDRIDGRWGRRLPFLLVGVPLAALTFAALPWAGAALWTLLAVDVVFLLAVTLYRAPLVALMPDHVAPADRSAANGVIALMAAIGGALALVLLAPTFDLLRWLPFAIAGCVALVALVVVLMSAHPHPPFVARGAIQDEAPLLSGLVRDVRGLGGPAQRGPALLLAGLFFCFFGFAAIEAQFSVFATETLAVSGGQAGRWLGVASLAFVAVALPAGFIARRLGELATMRAGVLGLAAAVTVAGSTDVHAVLTAALAFAGASWAFLLVPAYPLVADQGGRDRVGTFTGLYYLFGSGAAIVAPGLSGAAMDAFGNRALFAAAAGALSIGFLLLTGARRRGVRSVPAVELDAATAGEQTDQEQRDGDDEQGVDEATERGAGDQAEEPQHQ